MKKLFNIHTLLNVLFKVLVIFIVIKIFWMIVGGIFLSSKGEDMIVPKKPFDKKFDFISSFDLSTVKKTPLKRVAPRKTPRLSLNKFDINKIKILALFVDSVDSQKSFVSFYDDKELHFVYLDTIYKDYTLIIVDRDYAIFTDESLVRYTLYLDLQDSKEKSKYTIEEEEKETENIQSSIEQSNGLISVNKEDISKYLLDMNNIFRDIRFKPSKKDGTLQGYKIYFIKPKSLFHSIGLKVGDIITTVNDKTLTKNSNLLALYSKRDEMDYLNVQFIRDGILQEIEYEINE